VIFVEWKAPCKYVKVSEKISDQILRGSEQRNKKGKPKKETCNTAKGNLLKNPGGPN